MKNKKKILELLVKELGRIIERPVSHDEAINCNSESYLHLENLLNNGGYRLVLVHVKSGVTGGVLGFNGNASGVKIDVMIGRIEGVIAGLKYHDYYKITKTTTNHNQNDFHPGC